MLFYRPTNSSRCSLMSAVCNKYNSSPARVLSDLSVRYPSRCNRVLIKSLLMVLFCLGTTNPTEWSLDNSLYYYNLIRVKSFVSNGKGLPVDVYRLLQSAEKLLSPTLPLLSIRAQCLASPASYRGPRAESFFGRHGHGSRNANYWLGVTYADGVSTNHETPSNRVRVSVNPKLQSHKDMMCCINKINCLMLLLLLLVVVVEKVK